MMPQDTMKIVWERTVIGGETAPGDFVAKVEGQTVGRIQPHISGHRRDHFEWSFQLGHSDFRKGELNGVVPTKQEAVAHVKAEFARWLEYPEEKGGGKDLPVEYWSPGANRKAWRDKRGK